MDTVTYPHAEVQDLLENHFVAMRVNAKEPPAEFAELVAGSPLFWTPAFLFLDFRKMEVRRVLGYRPPSELLAELRLALGFFDFLGSRFDSSADHFRAAAGLSPTPSVAPEALFWAGIAAYRRDERSRATLWREWEVLRARFPENDWWRRADVFPEPPQGARLHRIGAEEGKR